ncbi:MAG: cohesin domain-containing protein [bacterium]
MKGYWIIYFLFFIFGSSLVNSTTLRVAPLSTISTSYQEFVVNVEVGSVSDLYGCGFDLVFDPNLLRVINFSEGDFLKQDGSPTLFVGTITEGRLILGITRQGTVSGVSGSGTLASIVLKPKANGTTTLTLSSISLKNSTLTTILATFTSASVFINLPPTKLSLNPSVATITSGHSFTMDVIASDAEDLYACNFDLVFDPNLLSIAGFSEGSFLKQDGSLTLFVGTITEGRLILGITRQGTVSGVSGSGTLASIILRPKANGTTTLTLSSVSLKNSSLLPTPYSLLPSSIFINIPPVALSIIPQCATITSGKEFKVDITANNAEDLYACNLDLLFPSDKLSIATFTEGSFLKKDGSLTLFVGTITEGRLILGITRQGTVSGVSGSGTLASIVLRPKGSQTAILTLSSVSLKNSSLLPTPYSLLPTSINILPIRLRITPDKTEVLTAREFTVLVNIEDVCNLYGCNIDLVFDPNLMETGFGKIIEGDFLKKDGIDTSFMKTIKEGRAIIGITRKEKVDGVNGTGTLCSVTFKTKGFGSSSLGFDNIKLENTKEMMAGEGKSSSVNVIPTKLKLEPEKTEIKLDRACTIDLMVEDQLDLYSSSFDLVFDPLLLGSITFTEGRFLNRDGKKTLFQGTITTGTITLGITRCGNVSGISGNGKLCSITFYGSSSGTSNIACKNLFFQNSKKESVGIKANLATITISDVKAKSIKGRVMTLDKIPLPGITVVLKEQSFKAETKTDTNGEYAFLNPQAGNYEVKVMGALNLSAKTSIGIGEEKNDFDFSLGDKAGILPDREMVVEKDKTRVIFGSQTFVNEVYVEIVEPVISGIKPLVATEIKLSGTDTSLNNPAILELSYPVNYLNPDELRIFKLIDNTWRLLGGEVDKEKGVVRVTTSSFSIFGLMPLSDAMDAPLKYVYPNPCKQYKEVIFEFDALPVQCRIDIYTIAGELVKTIENDNKWYLTNNDGKKVASGVYIYFAKGNNWKKIGKIGVVK